MDDLTDRQREVLAFAALRWQHTGAKETAIRERFGCSATLFYQELNALIDLPAALVHDPMLIKRLRRLRTTRTRARSSRAG